MKISKVRSLKILAIEQSEDAYLRPYGDDEGGQSSTPSRGRKMR